MEITRRKVLAIGALSALGWTAGARRALSQVTVTPQSGRKRDEVLVSIFLRGGADGLSLVVPHGDDDYYRCRPTLALARPNDAGTKATNRVADLDGYFGLHPALRPLMPLYESGQMAIVHACGSGDQTRSHFEAMATMERGLFQEAGPASGWVARHLQSAPWDNPSPLRAVALGPMLPASLSGTSATAMETVADLSLQSPFAGGQNAMMHSLNSLYGGKDALGQAGREALSVMKTLTALTPDQNRSAPGTKYPQSDLGEGLRQVALLMKSEVGLEAACLDHNGYDTHVAQGNSQGYLSDILHTLALSLSAFAADLGPARWARTTVIVLSEFGRRVEENSGLGTDHGRAGAMFVLGGQGIAGGHVHGVWPGLAPHQLEGPGDLKVTTDYRSVLAEVLSRRIGNPHTADIFPGLTPQSVGVTDA